MRTIEQASKHSGLPIRLIRAVIRQTGKDNLPDIMNHGADSGFAGFTYYRETIAFYKRNRADIVEHAHRLADEFGQSLIEFVASFRCLKTDNPQYKRETEDEIGRALYGRLLSEDTQVANALAWFAAEEVARAMCDE